jgi:hypothetical protein
MIETIAPLTNSNSLTPKEERQNLLRAVFPPSLLLPQTRIDLRASPLTAERLNAELLQTFMENPGSKIGIRSVMANETLGKAPFLPPFDSIQIRAEITGFIKSIEGANPVALFLYVLPDDFGLDPTLQFAGKFATGMPADGQFGEILEAVAGAANSRVLESVDASKVYRVRRMGGSLSPEEIWSAADPINNDDWENIAMDGATQAADGSLLIQDETGNWVPYHLTNSDGSPRFTIEQERSLFLYFFNILPEKDFRQGMQTLSDHGYPMVDFVGMFNQTGDVRRVWIIDCDK